MTNASKTRTVKVESLSGLALDWAADAAETGDPMRVLYKKDGSGEWMFFDRSLPRPEGPEKYSSEWRLAGPIIERERLSLIPASDSGVTESGAEYSKPSGWRAAKPKLFWQQVPIFTGKTPLEAAMRCYVASKLGGEIEMPEELLSCD